MKSKIDMDTTQLDVYYQNDLYLLEVREVQKGKPYLICLCKKCHRFLSIPYQYKNTKLMKCKYCNPDIVLNNQTKEKLKTEMKEKFDMDKTIYSNNKQEYLEQRNKKAQQDFERKKANLQIRILQELKDENKLNNKQKDYLKEQEQEIKKLYSGSKGEKSVAMLLNEYNIPFKREKTFPDLIYPDTKRKPRFDFWVNNEYIIEFDGNQHYNGGFETLSGKTLEEQQQDDKFKDNYCFKHNIPIIRIPYWKLNDLTIDDLKIETSSYVLN